MHFRFPTVFIDTVHFRSRDVLDGQRHRIAVSVLSVCVCRMLIKAGDGLWLLTGIKWSRTPAISDLQNPVRLVNANNEGDGGGKGEVGKECSAN